MMKNITVRGLFLAACIIFLAMQPFAAFAASVNSPGPVTTWGEGTFKPIAVVFPEGVVPVSVSAYELAITNDGLYAWGMNLSGCLGTGTGTTALPVKVKFPKAVTTVTAIAASTSHSLAITNDGLYAWGNNSAGQLGISGFSYKLTPAKVNGEDNAFDIATAECSSLH